MDITTILIPIVAFVLSGLTWTMGGYIASWRKNHNDPNWEGFNYASMRNDAILGSLLGVGVVVYTVITTGDIAPILTAQEFFLKIGEGMTLVVIVDKFIIGGLKRSTPTNPTN